jgi:hypothetical protein
MSDDLDTVVADSVADAQSAASDPAPVADPAPGDAAPAPAAPASGFSDDDYKTFGLDSQAPLQPGQRENRIPYSRVRAIVENARRKLHKDFDTERGKATETQRALEARLQQMDALGDIMRSDPARFLQMLQQVNPAYGQFQSASPAAGNGQPPGDGRPEPDLDLGNGYRTYSPQGLEKLLDWQAGHLEARLQQRYQPLEDRHREQQILADAGQRVNAQLADAMTWPLFDKYAPDILEALKKDSADARARGQHSQLTLEAAYRQVVLPRLALQRDQLRAEVLKELQTAPTSTAAPTAGATGTGGAPRSLDDVIYAAIRAQPTR